MISDLRDGAANCGLSSETFPGKLHDRKVASCSFDFFFSYLQLCPALLLSISIIKDCMQILSFSQHEKTFFDRYLDTGEQGKQLPLSDDFCGVCLKHIAFAYKPLVIAI